MTSAILNLSSGCKLLWHGVSLPCLPALGRAAMPASFAKIKRTGPSADVSLKTRLHARHGYANSVNARHASVVVRPRREKFVASAAPREEAEAEAGGLRDGTLISEQIEQMLLESQECCHVLSILSRAREQGVTLKTDTMVAAVARLAKVAREMHAVTSNATFVALLDGIWAEFAQRSDAFSPRQLTNLALSLSMMGDLSLHCGDGLDLLEREIVRRMPEFASQDLLDAVKGLAGARRSWQRFYSAASAEIITRGLASLDAQTISSTVWAFATAGQNDMGVTYVEELGGGSMRQPVVYLDKPGQVSAANSGHLRPQLCMAVNAELAARGLDSFKPQDLSLLLYSYAIAGMSAGLGGQALYDAAEKYILTRGLGCFNEEEVCDCLWAFTCAGLGSPVLYAAIEAEFVKRGVDAFGGENTVHALWALASAGRVQNPATRAMEAACWDHGGASSCGMPIKAWGALYAYMSAFDKGSRGVGPSDGAKNRAAYLMPWNEGLDERPTFASPIYDDVHSVLRGMGASALDFPFTFDDTTYYASLGMKHRDGTWVVVHPGGPFPRFRGSQVLHTCPDLKRRYYDRWGWKVASVPFWEWSLLKTREEKEEYLRGKLLACGMELPAVKGHKKGEPLVATQ